jgi:hypothetical protein
VKLPDVDYGGPVEGTAQTAALPYEAAAGSSKVISEGLRAYSLELIKTQQQEAAVQVAEGLNQAESEIKARKYVTPDELRATFGDAMPAHVQELARQADERKSADDVAGSQIPMWKVGDSLYAMKAKQLTEGAAKGISGIGWQGEFKGQMEKFVVDRRQGMTTFQLHAMDEHIQAEQLNLVDKLVNAKDFGAARAILDDSMALSPAIKLKVGAIVEAAKQEQPAKDALSSNDPAVIKAQADRLRSDPAAAAAIPEDKRRSRVLELEERWQGLEAGRLATVALQSGQSPGSRNLDEVAIFNSLQGQLAGQPPGLAKETRQLVKARVEEFHEVRKNETGRVFAVALQAFDAPGALQFKTSAVPAAARAYLIDPANGKEAADLWSSLLSKEEAERSRRESEVLRGRTLAEKPTEANWSAYGALVKEMLDDPAKYRTMTGDRFTSEVYAKVGPLISQAMALYKSTNEPQGDPRHLSVDELGAAMKVVPPGYKTKSKVENPDSLEGKIYAEFQRRLGDRKEKEWRDKKGPVPQTLMREWAAEEWAAGTVKGGRLWGLIDRGGVPKIVAPFAYPGEAWTPNAGAAPAHGVPSGELPRPKSPAVGTRVAGEALGRSGGVYERVTSGWKRVQ